MTSRPFEPDEAAAAERTDALIDAAFSRARTGVPDTGGRSGANGDDPTRRLVAHLSVIYGAPVTDDLRERVGASVQAAATASAAGSQQRTEAGAPDAARARRLLVAARVVAAALASLFLLQAVPNIVAPERLAAYLRLNSEPHVYREAGFAFLVLGSALWVAVIRPRLLATVSSMAVPLALFLGVFGMFEIGHSPRPSAEYLHFEQAAVGILLALLLVAHRRASKRGQEAP